MKFSTVLAVACATFVAASDLSTDENAVSVIQTDTMNQQGPINSYVAGNPNSAKALIASSTSLENDLKAQTSDVAATGTLSFSDSASLAAPIQSLVNTVNTTLQDLINIESKIAQDCQITTTYNTLLTLNSSSATFGTTLNSKVDPSLQPTGQMFLNEIAASFAQALSAYSGGDSGCSTSSSAASSATSATSSSATSASVAPTTSSSAPATSSMASSSATSSAGAGSGSTSSAAAAPTTSMSGNTTVVVSMTSAASTAAATTTAGSAPITAGAAQAFVSIGAVALAAVAAVVMV